MKPEIVENFVQSYLMTAEWVTIDDKSRGFTKLAKNKAKIECLNFIGLVVKNFTENEAESILTYKGDDLTCLAGHDFFLTSNHHGAGFWDKPIYDELAENGCNRLTDLAKICGSIDVYQQNGYLHIM